MAAVKYENTQTLFHCTVFKKQEDDEFILPIPNFVMAHDVGAINIQAISENTSIEVDIYKTLASPTDVKYDAESGELNPDLWLTKEGWVEIGSITEPGFLDVTDLPLTGLRVSFPGTLPESGSVAVVITIQ